MTENHELAVGSNLTRREMLRRGAALGAAVAVATPVVQGLGRVSAFAQVTPEPSPSPSPSPEPGNRPSHFQIVVAFGSVTNIGLKFDSSDGVNWDWIPDAVDCFSNTVDPRTVPYYEDMTVLDAFRAGNFVRIEPDSFVLTGLPTDFTYVDGKAFDGSFGGDKCGPSVSFVDGEAVFTT